MIRTILRPFRPVYRPATRTWAQFQDRLWLSKLGVVFPCFPRSGSTWLRFFLGSYAQQVFGLPSMPLFEGIEHRLPEFRGYPGPQMFFTHRPLDWRGQDPQDLRFENVVAPFRKKKVVILVRHPLDVMLSFYFHMAVKSTYYKGNLTNFVNDREIGLEKYFEFYSVWAKYISECRAVLVHRYEDAKSDPAGCGWRAIAFCGLPQDRGAFDEALERSSFERMQRLEASASPLAYRSSGLAVFGRSSATDAQTRHVREGRSGSYREHLPPAELERLRAVIAERMPPVYGYE